MEWKSQMASITIKEDDLPMEPVGSMVAGKYRQFFNSILVGLGLRIKKKNPSITLEDIEKSLKTAQFDISKELGKQYFGHSSLFKEFEKEAKDATV